MTMLRTCRVARVRFAARAHLLLQQRELLRVARAAITSLFIGCLFP